MEQLISLIPSILAAGIPAATPVLLAALGEILAERSGVMNIGLEGVMMMGCMAGAMVTLATQSCMYGLGAAMAVGGVLGLIHSFITVTLKGNQIVSGLAMVLLGSGLSTILGKPVLGQPIFNVFYPMKIPIFARIPYVGDILFGHDMITYFGIMLVPVLWLFLHMTRPGIIIRAAGESPKTVDSLGVNVDFVRYASVITGSVLAGAGGAYLSLVNSPCWIEGMTAGCGWIAIAVVIFAKWDPFKALIGAWIYGAVQALGYRIQAVGVPVAPQFLNMLPYLAPIAVLIVTARRYRGEGIAPAALGIPYVRESN